MYNENDLTAMQKKNLNYPLIVKHHNGHDSIGLSPQSKVSNLDSLIKQTRLVVDEFGGALVEEFIDGPEFTVLVVADASII